MKLMETDQTTLVRVWNVYWCLCRCVHYERKMKAGRSSRESFVRGVIEKPNKQEKSGTDAVPLTLTVDFDIIFP